MKQMKNKTVAKTRGAKQPITLVKKDGAVALEPRLTMSQAMRYTGRSYGMIYRHALEGKIECEQAGPGCIMFFTMPALNAYMAQSKTGAPLSKFEESVIARRRAKKSGRR